MDRQYNLYSSEGCHLCELALAICHPLITAKQLNIVDIVEDENLVALYGVHIPVLERLNDGSSETSVSSKLSKTEKLFWPFTVEQVVQLIA